jgi:hypothetical protein
MFTLAGCHTGSHHAPSDAAAPGALSGAQTLDVRADIDGSDELRITPAGLQWSHKCWKRPSNVWVNDRPLNIDSGPFSLADAGLSLTPADFRHLTVRVITRSGRDTAAVETVPGRVSIFFADTPNGSDTYHVRIRLVPGRASSKAPD